LVDEIEGEEVVSIPGIADEFDVSLHLAHRMEVVFRKIPGDAEKARPRPADRFGLVRSEFSDDE